MSDNERELSQPPSGDVTVTEWSACINLDDNLMVLSCTIAAADGSDGITGVGLILNTEGGQTLASVYTSLSGGSHTVYPGINLPNTKLSVGQNVSAVAQGECNKRHFFFEQDLTIHRC